MAGNALIGNLAVTLGLNTAAFERGANRAEARAKTLHGRMSKIGDAMKGFAGGLVAGVGIAGITAIASSAFQMASALDESAQKMGVTVEALQELNLAADQSGVSQEALATAMARMSKSVGALAQGSKPATAAFAQLGLSFEDLKGKAPDQQLRIIADALNKLPTFQERVKVGNEIMGRGFSQLLPLINEGSAGLEKYAQQSQKNGQITTDEAKRLDELSDSWGRLKVQVGVFAAKIIAMMSELSGKLDESLVKWYTWRDGVIKAVGDLASGAVNALNNLASGVRNAIVNGLGKTMDWAKGKIQEVGDKFKWLWDVTVGHSYVPDMVKGIGDSMSQLQKIMVDPALSATEKVGSAFQSLAGVVGDLFGQKAGSIVSAIGGLATALAPLFGGGISASTIANAPSGIGGGALPGLAGGGSGVFGGKSGVDKNVLSMNGSPIMRVSKGEHFRVSANDAAPAAKVLIVPTPYFDAHVQGQAAAVAAPMAGRAAIAGASGAMNGIYRRRARMLP